MSGTETNCFAIRRLSPFQGCLQVIEAQDAQASSSNGIDWRIQVRAQTPLDQWGSMDGSRPDHQIILFGFWSSEGGFHRVPLPPLISSRQVEIAAQPIIDVLLDLTRHVPFPQRDHCELWLLDEKELKPLVLIAASRDPEQLPNIRRPEWQPSLLTDHSFTSNWSKGQPDDPAYAAREALANLVNHRSGQNPKAQWFERQTDGSGKGLGGISLDASYRQRILSKDEFPELLIREDWPDEEAQQLINDYIEWQAPFLLTLPTLRKLTRKRIEQLAFKQAFKVEGQHKLWPEILDEERLKAILIEVQMRRSNPNAGEND